MAFQAKYYEKHLFWKVFLIVLIFLIIGDYLVKYENMRNDFEKSFLVPKRS